MTVDIGLHVLLVILGRAMVDLLQVAWRVVSCELLAALRVGGGVLLIVKLLIGL